MASELNMYESQVSEYKYEIERLAKELQDVKKKYYTQKRKEQQARFVGNYLMLHNQSIFCRAQLVLNDCFVSSLVGKLHDFTIAAGDVLKWSYVILTSAVASPKLEQHLHSFGEHYINQVIRLNCVA